MSRSCVLSASLAASLLAVAVPAPAPAARAERQIVARVDGEPVYLDEVEPRLALEAFRLEADLHRLLERGVSDLLDERLLEREAEKRGLAPDELLSREVDRKTPPVDPEAVDAYLAQRDRSDDGPEVRSRVAAYLAERARIARRLEFLAELRQGVDLEMLVAPPEPPRVRLVLEGAPRRGAPEADVVLVHFAGFRCPLCSDSARWLSRLLAEHPGRLAWVHRTALSRTDDLSLAAAELAGAAQAAGTFWTLHDALLALEGRFDRDDLARLAVAEGLAADATPEALAVVLATRRVEVARELAESTRLGVREAPVIFVNGRYFHPSFGLDALRELVAEELARAERPPASAPAVPAGNGPEASPIDPPAPAGREETHVHPRS